MTALGAKGKMAGQSTAGRALGTSFSEMPTKAAVISAMNWRTPKIRTDMPAANLRPARKGQSHQRSLPKYWLAKVAPVPSLTTSPKWPVTRQAMVTM